MSDKMKIISFGELLERIIMEYKTHQSVYSVIALYKENSEKKPLSLFKRPLGNPFGPAAGPHTQLAQNIVACYVGGARFFELKTVQVIDGDDLHVEKPCIRAEDECYNVEWSSELYVKEAFNEYVKAWFACKVLAKEFGFSAPDDFQFNMSVGYDLKGIQSTKIDAFIEGLKDASQSDVWKECKAYTLQHLAMFEHIDATYVENISPCICNSITLSTMHGCPADEIEKITTYLLGTKKLNTYLKCNPTLLGYAFTRKTMDAMGYDYTQFDRQHFNADLQFDDAIIMMKILMKTAKELGLIFGVKLSNTFPVLISKAELPGKEMYMSGKSLYPLTIHVAAKLARAFDGKLPISYSGGADMHNSKQIFETGIWPITVATILLKPTGYNKIKGLVELLETSKYPSDQKVDVEKVEALATSALLDKNYYKSQSMRERPIQAYFGNRKEGIDCKVVCGNCMNICPNRANIVLLLESGKLLLHMDDACNECGNCYFFCPDKCTPYKDRLTMYSTLENFNGNNHQGFLLLKGQEVMYRLDGVVGNCLLKDAPATLRKVVETLQKEYAYLLIKSEC